MYLEGNLALIHATAVVDSSVRLDESVEIGPYAVIHSGVEIAEGTRIGAHTVIHGHCRIGRGNNIHPFCSIGDAPQDKKYQGEESVLVIGNHNTIREYATLNRGTLHGQGVTRVGDGNYFMAYSHVAHDCIVGNHTVFANGASLGGHVAVDDHVILGGFVLVHQFCRVGVHGFCGMGTTISKDVPPYVTVSGNPGRPRGINLEGLRRRGFPPAAVAHIRRAYRLLYRSGLRLSEAIAAIREFASGRPEIGVLLEFLVQSRRSIVR